MMERPEQFGWTRTRPAPGREGGGGSPGGRRASPGAQGTILIVTIWILLTLAGLVLVLARAMRVEGGCSANGAAALQADAIEQGAIQYVLAHVDGLAGEAPADADMPCEAVRVGDGAFWVLRPNFDDDRACAYGLVDEASKLNLNTASARMLSMLPGVTPELAAAIVDWRDADSAVTPGGAEGEYYLLLSDPYQCKDAPLETVEELLLVKDATKGVLYGEDANRNGVLDPNEDDGVASDPPDNRDGRLDRGLGPFVTVYSSEPASSSTAGRPGGGGGSSGGTVSGRICVNTAPREVLACLPGLEDADVSVLLAKRSDGATDLGGTAWVAQALPPAKFAAIRYLITAKAYQFSADIVSVAGNGRAFQRCRIVVDARASPPKVVYRQDLTHLGWPLDEDILVKLRAGAGLDQVVSPAKLTNASVP